MLSRFDFHRGLGFALAGHTPNALHSGSSRYPGISGLEHVTAGRHIEEMQTGIKYLPESLAEPAALAASYARFLPSLTLIITCGDQDVRLPLLSRHKVCILNSNMTCVRAQVPALQQRCAPLSLVRETLNPFYSFRFPHLIFFRCPLL